MTELEELDRRVSWHPFTQMREWKPLVIARGEGNYLIDEAGRRYLDGVSSLWCNVHGHRHPRLDRALVTQLEQIAHSTYLGLTHEPGIRLAGALIAAAPANLTRVFFSDSGSTAVEIALKQSFQYWALVGHPSKTKFLRLVDAYHGDTLGAVGVGGIDLFHRIFAPLLVDSIAIPSPSVDEAYSRAQLEMTLSRRHHEIAAFVMEPLVQGAAGILVHPPGYLRHAEDLCRRMQVHLIVDEVATGFGRTGTVFACEQEQASPDFLCLGKGITGGYLPLAATLSTETIFEAFLGRHSELRQFFHGHTYTANPLACAVGLESLALLQEQTLLAGQCMIEPMAKALTRISKIDGVDRVRHCGLMAGIALEPQQPQLAARVCEQARNHGVILRPLGNVVVWMPPLTISLSDLALLEQATSAAIRECLL